MNKLLKFLFISLFAVSSCTIVEETDSKDVLKWSADTAYRAGTFVVYDGKYYKATTTTKGESPHQNVSSAATPYGAWAPSSIEAYRFAQRTVSVSETGMKTKPSLSDIPTWKNGVVYHGNDLVKTSIGYFKSMWWNQNQNPSKDENKNNYLDESGITHWGPWVPLTAEEALEFLEEQQDVVSPPPVDPEEPGDGNDGEITPPPTVEDPTGIVPSDILNKYEWKSETIYLENYLAVIKGATFDTHRFFRSKWWNQGHTPATPYEFAWDSPWEEISESRFEDLRTNAGTTPPPVVDPDDGNNGGVNPPPVTPPAPEYAEIHARGYIQEWDWDDFDPRLKEAFNENSLNGRDIFATQDGSQALSLFSSKIGSRQWDQLFPRRRGSEGWYQNNVGTPAGSVEDYYSYENFREAMMIIGEYAYLIDKALDHAGNPTFFEKNYILHKPSRKVRLISQSDDYFAANNEWLTGREHKATVVDYAAFGFEGSDNDKKRVVAGFLAHASHETSGSWATAPDWAFDKSAFPGANFPDFITTRLPGELAWSLYFNEEVSYAGSTSPSTPYTLASHKIFPPSNKSYHGRGAFQLSWNYNYGLASAIFFGDSNVLLDEPEMIVEGGIIPSNPEGDTWRAGERLEGGTLAFLTSLMFWLTPQGAKPSQQDTMILNRTDGRYIQGTAKLTKDNGRGEPGYGWTINIMNGGFEADKSWIEGTPGYDPKVARRIKHYTFFTQALGGNNEGEKLDTRGYHSY